MFVVIKNKNEGKEIIKVHLDDIFSLQKWTDEYIQGEIHGLMMSPIEKDIRNISYKIISNENIFTLVKEFKKIQRGYVYNSSEYKTETVFTIEFVKCDETVFLNETNKSEYWFKNNKNINLSVIKQLDRESLFNVFSHFIQLTEQKPKRIHEECASMLSNSLRVIKKELYNTTIKRIKRMSKNTKHE